MQFMHDAASARLAVSAPAPAERETLQIAVIARVSGCEAAKVLSSCFHSSHLLHTSLLFASPVLAETMLDLPNSVLSTRSKRS